MTLQNCIGEVVSDTTELYWEVVSDTTELYRGGGE